MDLPVYRRLDGRTLRRTGRTQQLGLKVTPEFDANLRDIAAARGVLLIEVLEEAMALYLARGAAAAVPVEERR